MPRRLPSNPWSRPCSVDATWRVISPCDAAHDNPQNDERGQHGRDEAEGEHVEQDGDEDEGERGRAAHGSRRNSSPEVEIRSSRSAGWRADTNVADPYSASTTGPNRARKRASWNMSTGFGGASG